MSFKPADFFLGIFDLFGILMPGALLLLWLQPKIRTEYMPASVWDQMSSGSAKWVAFLFASYLLGHIISTCGGFIGMIASKKIDYLIDLCQAHKLTELKKKAIKIIGNLKVEIDVHLIIPKYIKTINSVAAMEIDRLRALARLFRSLTLVFLIISIPCIYNSNPVFLWLVLVTLWLFFYTHWKQKVITYEYFIAQYLADGKLQP